MSIENLKKEVALKLAINLLDKGTDKHFTARVTGLAIEKINKLNCKCRENLIAP